MVLSDIKTPFPFQFGWLKTKVDFLMELPQTNTTSCLEKNISYRHVLHLFSCSSLGIYQGFSSKEDPDCTIRKTNRINSPREISPHQRSACGARDTALASRSPTSGLNCISPLPQQPQIYKHSSSQDRKLPHSLNTSISLPWVTSLAGLCSQVQLQLWRAQTPPRHNY